MTNQEFQKIIETEKQFLGSFSIPKINTVGQKEVIDLNNNKYIFDYQLGSAGKFYIELSLTSAKQKWQIRSGIPLIRIDINSSPHMCVDTGKVDRNHIHVCYPEGEKTYAISNFSEDLYKNLSPYDILNDFFKHVHINYDMGNIQEGI